MNNKILREKIERIVEETMMQIHLREAVRNVIVEALNEDDERMKNNSKETKRNTEQERQIA